MQEEYPFNHILVDNFLSDIEFNKLNSFFNTQSFELKHTDLFKFMQTSEIQAEPQLCHFKEKLTNIFTKLYDTKNSYYTIFASYYRKDDFLLCHDDMVDGRKYAFILYLNDFTSGDLILYDNNCIKEVKRINVKKNKLVIFEVSNISWHGVDICCNDGRKAITGWINDDSISNLMQETEKLDFNFPKNISYCKIDLEIPEFVTEIPGMAYNFDFYKKEIEGKFYMRCVQRILLDEYIVLDVMDYSLVYLNSYLINNDSYILLNDSTNQIEGSLLDVFIIESKYLEDGNINLIDEEGKLINTLKIQQKVMYLVNRSKMKYFIERNKCKKEYFMIHMIYKKN